MRTAQKKFVNGSGSGQLPIGRLSSKGPMKQKLHPGMISTQDRATAHYGAVTGLKVTEDGMYLLSAGCLFIIYTVLFNRPMLRTVSYTSLRKFEEHFV